VSVGAYQLVEAGGFEPPCQVAKTQASTSIAFHLIFARRPPVGRLPVALAALCFPPAPSGGSQAVAQIGDILHPADGRGGRGRAARRRRFHWLISPLREKLGSQRIRALRGERGVLRVYCFAAFNEASGASTRNPSNQSPNRNQSPPCVSDISIITYISQNLFPCRYFLIFACFLL